MSTHELKDSPRDRFEELVVKYGHVIRAAVYKAGGLRSGLQAEDVEQSVLLEVWKQVSREQEIQYPSSYLYRAAVRETVRLVNKARRSAEQSLDEASTHVRQQSPFATTADPAEQFRASEIRREIKEALDDLAPDRRRAVRDHLAGYKVREIMKRYNWTYGRARNLVARGMADLRSKLSARGLAND